MRYPGFRKPQSNYFRLPNEWTDITAGIDSLAELKVVEYILRHTWGFHEYGVTKRITVDEFMRGRCRDDGSRMDRGTGLSEQSVRNGLQRALDDGLIIEDVDASDRGRIKKSYALRMAQDVGPGAKDLDPEVHEPATRGQTHGPRTEKDTPETNHEKEDDAWKLALRETLTDSSYALWIAPLDVIRRNNRTVVLSAPNPQVADYARRRLDGVLCRALGADEIEVVERR